MALWREAHFQVKKHKAIKTPDVQPTFEISGS